MAMSGCSQKEGPSNVIGVNQSLNPVAKETLVELSLSPLGRTEKQVPREHCHLQLPFLWHTGRQGGTEIVLHAHCPF